MELFNFPEYNQPIGKINNLINDIIKVVINISTEKCYLSSNWTYSLSYILFVLNQFSQNSIYYRWNTDSPLNPYMGQK
ncbi:hypothetical protein M120_5389 [Bacteroides fragilis str. 3783N1-8]|nr:hypothetical protein M120_5389 [Bacteroides fragilis str. 3783N1-8]